MRTRLLPVGSSVELVADGHHETFVIEEMMGEGASCVAYKVSYEHVNSESDELDRTTYTGILKEFCPAFLLEDPGFDRVSSNVDVPTALREKFDSEMRDFKESYKLINDYLRNNEKAVNYHSHQQGMYLGNNTAYILFPFEVGVCLSDAGDMDLRSLLRITHAVATAVEFYHNAGLLHLDIKPGNFFLVTVDDADGVSGIIRQFDYDSLVPIRRIEDAVKCGGEDAPELPMPGVYMVPELERQSLKEVGVHTDVFEIGAMLYTFLFGEDPTFGGFCGDDDMELDSADCLKCVPPAVTFELEQFFRCTVSKSKWDRYGSVAEVKAHLERIIGAVDRGGNYLINKPAWVPTAYFTGRDREILDIDRCLGKYGYAFVKGHGGIGKTETVKKYAETFAGKYHTVLFCEYKGSLRETVKSLEVGGLSDTDFSTDDEIYRAKNAVLHQCDGHTLVVVDNFCCAHDDDMRTFLPADNESFKVIFTTRCNYAKRAYLTDRLISIDRLPADTCKRLFCSMAGISADDAYADEIVSLADRNTLMIELLAKAVKRSGGVCSAVAKYLRERRIRELAVPVYHDYDSASAEVEEFNTVSGHLDVVFDPVGLSGEEIHVLKNMASVPPEGIDVHAFAELYGVEPYRIYDLADMGWLELAGDTVCLNPVLADLIASAEHAIE